MLGHDYIGTEHVLLGLIHEGSGVAQALASSGISQESVRQKVEEIVGRGHVPQAEQMPFTPQARSALQLSLREATQLGHDYIDTEHILLALLRDDAGPVGQVLSRLGASPERLRRQVTGMLCGQPADQAPGAAGLAEPYRRTGPAKPGLLSRLLARADSMK